MYGSTGVPAPPNSLVVEERVPIVGAGPSAVEVSEFGISLLRRFPLPCASWVGAMRTNGGWAVMVQTWADGVLLTPQQDLHYVFGKTRWGECLRWGLLLRQLVPWMVRSSSRSFFFLSIQRSEWQWSHRDQLEWMVEESVVGVVAKPCCG